MSTITAVSNAAIADGLRFIAVMFDRGDVPAVDFPELAQQVCLLLETETGVRELAARLGAKVEQRAVGAATVHTSFEYPIGTGTQPDSDMPAYAGAVVLRATHIADVTR